MEQTQAAPLTPEQIAAQVGGKVIEDDWDKGEDIRSGWIKLAVDESVKGTFVGKRYQKSNKPGFKDQWVYELKVDGAILNIGFSIDKTFINGKMKNVVAGQIVMIKRFADVPSKMFPGKMANSYNVRMFGMDPDYNDAAPEEDGEINVNDMKM